MLTIYIVARRDSILGKTADQNSLNSISPGDTRHISYLNGGAVAATNIRCNNTKNSKHKTRKSPLERAKSIIKQHGERTGTGRVVKLKSKRKGRKACDGGITHQRVTNETRLVIQSISSPNVKQFTGSSTPVTGHEKSFDTSALIEELFDAQLGDDINGDDSSQSNDTIEGLRAGKKNESQIHHENGKENQELNQKSTSAR